MGQTKRPYAARLPPEQRREQLLDAALEVLARDGYAAISIEAIAREAGVTRPVVYSIFHGLGPLLSDLLDRQEARVLAELNAAMPPEGVTEPTWELLLAGIRRLADSITHDPLMWRPVLLEPQGLPAPARERIAVNRGRVLDHLRRVMPKLVLPSRFPDADHEVEAHALLAIGEYFGRQLIEDPTRFTTDRILAAAERLFAQFRD